MENVITLGKLIGLLFLFCPTPPLYFVFETPKIRGMTSLALYFLVYIYRDSQLNRPENEVKKVRKQEMVNEFSWIKIKQYHT